ncbi:glutamyl-tRNA synthetase [Microthyrium microscopicum]|uniref:glutamate--tRNA ligase n=1 Tax=Microthyrium microscopicum TaxID=703497 RepID=A0A6A6UN09_9PEZI|nr:glutamyl-tRNA synthetase [Microthyrium microscopicum]
MSADIVVQEWVARSAQFKSGDMKALESSFKELDAHLTLRSYIVGYGLTEADTAVFKEVNGNGKAKSFVKQGLYRNLTRWFTYIEDTNPDLKASALPIRTKGATAVAGDNFEIGLQNTEKGVVTRFPPEPSGYLHIGHAKAALLNDYFAHEKYKGTMILRFDDTNPSKEKEEFQDSIVEDLALMGVIPDKRSHTSDFFKELYEYCVQMLKEGTAYADDTTQEEMRAQRMDGLPSARRNSTPDENLARFAEMKTGSEEGKKWCIRAKISVDDPNKAMRDPVIYRCNPQPHHRTGDTWKIYPTYDFCCPIVDSIEGVTHALRTTEYNDRDPQYQWFIKTLRLRPVYNWGFSRLNFIRTLLSKRKLTKFVDTGLVSGWDDARMPTVRGIRRRGMTIPALREFIIKQGPSKSINLMDWSVFWATNKKQIDQVAARYIAVDEVDKVPATVQGVDKPHSAMKALHAKYNLGEKKVWFSKDIILDQADAATFEQDEEITLMNWGNAYVRSITKDSVSGMVTSLGFELHLEGDVKKTKKKITWLSVDQALTPVEMVDFDLLITKDKLDEDDNYEDFLTPQTEIRTNGLADENVRNLRLDDIIQIDRKGYFRVDQAYSEAQPAVLYNIPTGKMAKV